MKLQLEAENEILFYVNNVHEQYKLELQNPKIILLSKKFAFYLKLWCCYIGPQPQSLQISF